MKRMKRSGLMASPCRTPAVTVMGAVSPAGTDMYEEAPSYTDSIAQTQSSGMPRSRRTVKKKPPPGLSRPPATTLPQHALPPTIGAPQQPQPQGSPTPTGKSPSPPVEDATSPVAAGPSSRKTHLFTLFTHSLPPRDGSSGGSPTQSGTLCGLTPLRGGSPPRASPDPRSPPLTPTPFCDTSPLTKWHRHRIPPSRHHRSFPHSKPPQFPAQGGSPPTSTSLTTACTPPLAPPAGSIPVHTTSPSQQSRTTPPRQIRTQLGRFTGKHGNRRCFRPLPHIAYPPPTPHSPHHTHLHPSSTHPAKPPPPWNLMASSSATPPITATTLGSGPAPSKLITQCPISPPHPPDSTSPFLTSSASPNLFNPPLTNLSPPRLTHHPTPQSSHPPPPPNLTSPGL